MLKYINKIQFQLVCFKPTPTCASNSYKESRTPLTSTKFNSSKVSFHNLSITSFPSSEH